jgi:hypothetical protein
MEDEPFKAGQSGDAYDDLEHVHTFNSPKNIDLLREFREVLDNKTEEDIYNPRYGNAGYPYVAHRQTADSSDPKLARLRGDICFFMQLDFSLNGVVTDKKSS